MLVSYCLSVFSPTDFTSVFLAQAVDDIRGCKHRRQIDAIRAEKDKGKRKALKSKLPWYAFGGMFVGNITNGTLDKHSGLFLFDIDAIDDVDEAKRELMQIPGIVLLFVSPSGDGIKGLIKTNVVSSDAEYKLLFSHFEKEIKSYGYTIDPACKDIRRACFTSCDSKLFYNPGAAQVLVDIVAKPTKETQSVKVVSSHNITELLQYISPLIPYGDWLNVGFAIYYETNGSGYPLWESWSASRAGNGQQTATVEKWGSFGKSSNPKKIGYLVNMAKEGGYRNKNGQIKPAQAIEIESDDEAQDWTPSLSGGIDYNIPFDCPARDIQEWILDTSIRRQPALAFAAALGVLSTIKGRELNYGGIKGNVMSICLAESCEGKDHPLKAIGRIMGSAGKEGRLYGQMASGAALREAVEDHKSVCIVVDEFGHYLGGISGKASSMYSREIMPMITEIYTSAGDKYRGKTTKGNAGAVVTEPHLSLLGFSTEKQLLASITTSDLEDGSLARFMVFFGDFNVRRNRSRVADLDPPTHIKEIFSGDNGKFFAENWKSSKIKVSQEYKQAVGDIEERFDEMAFVLDEKSRMFKPFYQRIPVKAIQIALLMDGCRSVEVLQWCVDICLRSTDVFIKKFNHLVSEGIQEGNFKMVERAIKESGKNGIFLKDMYVKTKGIRRSDRKAILEDMLEARLIFERDVPVNGSARGSKKYYWKK